MITEVIKFMFLASPYEGAVFKFLYFSTVYLFSSERKYVPVDRALM